MIMRIAFLVLGLLLAGSAVPYVAHAQEPRPDPVVQQVIQQWQARQVMDQNVAQALDKLIAAWQQAVSDVAKARTELAEAKKRCGEPCAGIGEGEKAK